MKPIACILAAAALAGTVAGCADPYAPSYGYSQGYSYPAYSTRYYSAPSYPAYPAGYAYRQNDWNYYRNYNGAGSGGPSMTFTVYP